MENAISDFIFDKIGVPAYRKFLGLASLRHKLISGNVANVSTPGYRSKDIDFKAEFAKAGEQSKHIAGTVTHHGHMPLGSHSSRPPKILEQDIPSEQLNSVDVDREVSELARNELLFTIGARLLQRKFQGLRNAITSK
jgi:flagellar basal-body rod protein FlgB